MIPFNGIESTRAGQYIIWRFGIRSCRDHANSKIRKKSNSTAFLFGKKGSTLFRWQFINSFQYTAIRQFRLHAMSTLTNPIRINCDERERPIWLPFAFKLEFLCSPFFLSSQFVFFYIENKNHLRIIPVFI